MSTSNNEASLSSDRPTGGTVNEAVRASILAVKAAHRAARRRQLRDRLVAGAVVGLTATAIWGVCRQAGNEAPVANISAEAGSEEKLAAKTPSLPSAQTAAEPSPPVAPAQVAANPNPALEHASEAAAAAGPTPTAVAAAADTAPTTVTSVAPVAAAEAVDPAVAAACEKAVKRNHWITISSVCAIAFEQAPSAERALSVAQAFHRRGRIPEAGTWAEKVLAFEPTNPEAFIIVAHAADQAEQDAKAKAAYRQYLALAPHGWHAPEARGALGERP